MGDINEGFFQAYGQSDRDRDVITNDCCVDMTTELQQAILSYPLLAAPISVISGAGVYELGPPVELIPDSTPPFNVQYRIMDVFVSNISLKDKDFVIVLYQNGTVLPVASTRAKLSNVISSNEHARVESKPIPGGTGIYARVACEQAGGHTVSFSLQYKLTGQP